MEPNTLDKKTSLEELPKDDLIKKCKTLLSIAQKAKQSKQELQEELNQLKKEIAVQKKDEHAVQELIDNLTQQKLNFVTTVQNLELQNRTLEQHLKQSEKDRQHLESKVSDLDTENIGYKRQVTRLTEENDQLEAHLETLEKKIEELKEIGLQQQQQLLILEDNNRILEHNTREENDKCSELQNMLKVSLEEVRRLKEVDSEKVVEPLNLSEEISRLRKDIELKQNVIAENNQKVSDLNSSLFSFNETCSLLETKLNDKEVELINQNELNERLRKKVKLFHSKLVKFAGDVKNIRQDRDTVLEQYKTCVGQVHDWKDQLHSASQKLFQIIANYESENKELKESVQRLKDNNTRIIEQLEAHKTDDEKSKGIEEIENLRGVNSKLTNELSKLGNALTEKQELIDTLTNDLNSLNVKNQEFEADNDIKNNEILRLKNEIEEFQSKKNELSKTFEENSKTIRDLQNEVKDLESEVERSRSTEKQLAEKSGEEIIKLVQEIKTLTQTNESLQEKIDAIERVHIKFENVDIQTDEELIPVNEYEEKINNLKRENSQMLAEMNEMNQALKERGETISHLQVHQEEIVKKMQVYESQANKNVNCITEKEELINRLQQEIRALQTLNENGDTIKTLQSEIENLKEKLNANLDNSYAESDAMSNSTISRMDEINRLKDLEGSWEERYGKLRNLAIKQKAKLKELTNEIAKEKTEKSEIQQKLNNSIKSVHTLQAKCDQLEDDLENNRKQYEENKIEFDSVSKDSNKDKETIVRKDETISELTKALEELNKQKETTETWKSQVATKVKSLRKELDDKNKLIKNIESEMENLKIEFEAKDILYRNEVENHKQTKHLLQQSNSENKKKSVLSLEMQDYEKSVKDLSQKLENKQEQINKLKSQVEAQKNTISLTNQEIKALKEKFDASENNFNASTTEIHVYKKKINDLEAVISEKEAANSNLTQVIESLRTQNEELSTELSRDISEHKKMVDALKEDKEVYRTQTLTLQQTLREFQQKLELKEAEFKNICVEYESYKVRAQSVLRQNQSRDVGTEEKLSERIVSLESLVQQFKLKHEELEEKYAQLRSEKEKVTLDRDNLVSRIKDLSTDLQAIKEEKTNLANSHNQTISEHMETIRSLKIHAETLTNCYKQQLSEQEVRHNREIVELKSKIVKAPSPLESGPILPTMPREEGEGSESVESNVGHIHPVPLERLLANNGEEEVMYMKQQLQEQGSKISHLTDLLADTEQDLAKHVQMNKVLKEEIRRQQRAVEREKHAENLEYLKNVVLKFITLNSGDERSRLVPVINTILKLSPEELQKLNQVARGDPGYKGWSNYLTSWSGNGKT